MANRDEVILSHLIQITSDIGEIKAGIAANQTDLRGFKEVFNDHVEADKLIATDVKSLVALKDSNQGRAAAHAATQRGFTKFGSILLNVASALGGAYISTRFGNH